MTAGGGNATLISVHLEELEFKLELDKTCHCDLKVVNNTEHHVAFKNYFPEEILRAAKYQCDTTMGRKFHPSHFTSIAGVPPVQCRDKLLLQSTIVPPQSEVDDLSPDIDPALQQLKEERDVAVRQAQLLQQELDMMQRRRYHRKSNPGFSFRFGLLVAVIGIMVGFLLNFTLSSPVT